MKKHTKTRTSSTEAHKGDKLISDFLFRALRTPPSAEESAKRSVANILKKIDKEENKESNQKYFA